MPLAGVILTCDWHLIVKSDQEHRKRAVFLTNRELSKDKLKIDPRGPNKDKKQPEC